ncbi:LLM class flavin-dependent oxidoreductase [Streptomyces sp. NPDC097941]|uniref:LLM class flavin-dependent oxidoreductase n=1 Tax=Streptomyces sp. NPDC097941 TaxID=3155685 RepID=UPI0033325375
MKLGLAVPFVDHEALLSWAQRADEGPYHRLGLPDRIVYDNPETMMMLAAMAAVTTRIRLQSEILLAPLREPVVLAKQAATLDRLSRGRFSLGLGVGARDDDFRAVGADFARRGRRLEEQLTLMRRIWSGAPLNDGVGSVGPSPLHARGPELLFGAFAPSALARVARWGDGFLCAALPEQAGGMLQLVRRQWQEAGREGQPVLIGQINVALGPEATVEQARASMLRYYGFAPAFAETSATEMITTEDGIRQAVEAYRDLGADEVMLGCWSDEIGQVDRLADIAL